MFRSSTRPLLLNRFAFPLRREQKHRLTCPNKTDRTTDATSTATPNLDVRYKPSHPKKSGASLESGESLHLGSGMRLQCRTRPRDQLAGTERSAANEQPRVCYQAARLRNPCPKTPGWLPELRRATIFLTYIPHLTTSPKEKGLGRDKPQIVEGERVKKGRNARQSPC